MSLLHIVNQSPFERSAFDTCLRLSKAGAGLLLIEDGVYAAQAEGRAADKLHGALEKMTVYALAPDVAARGLGGKLHSDVTLVDYDGFVVLTTEYDRVQSWL